MLRLSMDPADLEWLDLPDGVRVQVRGLTTAIYESARASSTRRAAKILTDMDDMEGMGVAFADRPNLSDVDVASGYDQMLFIQGLARAAIVDWQGVGGPDGEPVRPTLEWIDALMRHHKHAETFLVRYVGGYEARRAEGNGSGVAPNGISAAAPDTADPVETAVPPAPKADAASTASGAPTSNTS